MLDLFHLSGGIALNCCCTDSFCNRTLSPVNRENTVTLRSAVIGPLLPSLLLLAVQKHPQFEWQIKQDLVLCENAFSLWQLIRIVFIKLNNVKSYLGGLALQLVRQWHCHMKAKLLHKVYTVDVEVLLLKLPASFFLLFFQSHLFLPFINLERFTYVWISLERPRPTIMSTHDRVDILEDWRSGHFEENFL